MSAARRTRGFTLVELLVVIGIIALLISILLPSLARARQAATKVTCASNLRQLGQGLTMYADSNKEQFPPKCRPGWVGVYNTASGRTVGYNGTDWQWPSFIWPYYLAPYIGIGDITPNMPNPNRDRFGTPFVCPEFLNSRGNQLMFNHILGGYSMNPWTPGTEPAAWVQLENNAPNWGQHWKLFFTDGGHRSKIKNAFSFPLITDGLSGHNGMMALSGNYSSTNMEQRYATDYERHDGLNVLYADGHVSFTSRAAFIRIVNPLNLNGSGLRQNNNDFVTNHVDY